MTPKVYQQSRYFALNMMVSLNITGEEIIQAIKERYPKVNYIMVKGKNQPNREYESTNKFILIQQTSGALKKDCVLKNILKDFPGTHAAHLDLTDTDMSTGTHFIASTGEFHPPHVRVEARETLKRKRLDDMTSDEKDDLIRQLFYTNAKLLQASNLDIIADIEPSKLPIIDTSISKLSGSDLSELSADVLGKDATIEFDNAVKIKAIRNLPESMKKLIAGQQNYRCANAPGSNKIIGFKCDRWNNDNGNFNAAGYDIDHIVEIADGGGNDMSNLQALCPSCHRVKTKGSSAARVVARKPIGRKPTDRKPTETNIF